MANLQHVIFQMTEVEMPRELFTAILEWIRRHSVPSPVVQRARVPRLAKNMTISARRQLLLPIVAGTRPPQRSEKRTWIGSGVQHLAVVLRAVARI